MFSFRRNHQIVFQSSCIILHSHWQCMRVPVSPDSHQYLSFSAFFITVILVGMKWFYWGSDLHFLNNYWYGVIYGNVKEGKKEGREGGWEEEKGEKEKGRKDRKGKREKEGKLELYLSCWNMKPFKVYWLHLFLGTLTLCLNVALTLPSTQPPQRWDPAFLFVPGGTEAKVQSQ